MSRRRPPPLDLPSRDGSSDLGVNSQAPFRAIVESGIGHPGREVAPEQAAVGMVRVFQVDEPEADPARLLGLALRHIPKEVLRRKELSIELPEEFRDAAG